MEAAQLIQFNTDHRSSWEAIISLSHVVVTKKGCNRIAELNTPKLSDTLKNLYMNNMIHNLLLHFKALHQINRFFKESTEEAGQGTVSEIEEFYVDHSVLKTRESNVSSN